MQRFLVLLFAVLFICGCDFLSNLQMRQASDGSLQFHSSSVPETKDEAFSLLPKKEGMEAIEDFMERNGWEKDRVWSTEDLTVFDKGSKSCALCYREKPDGTEITEVSTGGGSPTRYYIPAGTEEDIQTCLEHLGLAAKE